MIAKAKRLGSLVLPFLILVGCGFSQWKPLDKTLFVTYTVGNVIDIAQTREIKRNERFTELNPLLDGMSVDGATATMIGTNIAIGFVADWIPSWRTSILGICSTTKWGFVIHNNSIGVEAKW